MPRACRDRHLATGSYWGGLEGDCGDFLADGT